MIQYNLKTANRQSTFPSPLKTKSALVDVSVNCVGGLYQLEEALQIKRMELEHKRFEGANGERKYLSKNKCSNVGVRKSPQRAENEHGRNGEKAKNKSAPKYFELQ